MHDRQRRRRATTPDDELTTSERTSLIAELGFDPDAPENDFTVTRYIDKGTSTVAPPLAELTQRLDHVRREYDDVLIAIAAILSHSNTMDLDNLAKADNAQQWALIILSQLRQVREASDSMSRDLILGLIERGVIAPKQAATAAGYSRQSIFNWINKAAEEHAHSETVTKSP